MIKGMIAIVVFYVLLLCLVFGLSKACDWILSKLNI